MFASVMHRVEELSQETLVIPKGKEVSNLLSGHTGKFSINSRTTDGFVLGNVNRNEVSIFVAWNIFVAF
jgi:hypothetical protein